MTESSSNMEINILNKSYQIAFPNNEQEALRLAADFLNERIQETKIKTTTKSNEPLLAITALNLAHELLINHRSIDSQKATINQQLKRLSEKLSGISGDPNRTAATTTTATKDFGTTL